MKRVLFLIIAITFFGCETPKRVDWDKIFAESDSDSEKTDIDVGNTGNTGDTGDTGDTGNTGNTGDTGDTDSDFPDFDADADEFSDDLSDEVLTDLEVSDTELEDSDEASDDDVITPFCGNNLVEEGEVCDGNPKTCYSLNLGTSGMAECRSDCKGWITAAVCQRIFTCSDKPLNSMWNTVYEYTQTWNGSVWSPVDSVTSYNLTPSSTQCRFKCDTNYSWNSGSSQCVADTRVQSCGGLPPNSVWNTASSITQTWNGSAWIPSATGTYNTSESTTECRFKCNTNYNWNGSQCAAATRSGQVCTGLPENAEWNTVSSITQTWTGSDWAPSTTGVYNTTSSTTSCRFKCNNNYSWNSISSTCVADTQVSNCTGLPANAFWNEVSFITQTWSGSAWLPSTTGTHNVTASTTDCRFKCETGLSWNGTACVAGSTTGAICTGQTKCYNGTVEMTCPSSGSYYGQDAQYLDKCTPRSYTVSGTNPQEIVTDNNTGLQWQRTISTSEYLWQNAINYCDGLSYGGHDDWRLPTSSELETLPDYGKYSPAIDSTYFPSTPATSYFWGSDSYVNGTTNGWFVGFDSGWTFYTSKTSPSYTPDYVRCVRGDSLPTKTFTESTVSGKVIVTDSVTGLIWTKEYSSSVTWVNALIYCENLDYAGYTDWRLPNVNELKTLVNRTKYNPASDFPSMPAQVFWSSSSSVSNTNSAWVVNVSNGYVHGNSKTNAGYARCSR